MPSAAPQRIKAECPPNSEMELESELELESFEAAAGAWEGEKLSARLEADFAENTGLLKTQVEEALAGLVAGGLITADSLTDCEPS